MSEELRVWQVAESAGKVKPLEPFSEMPSESEFEGLLVGNPEMLEPGVKLVGRQTPTQTGWLDLLGVDQDGRLVVYELKRGTLARAAVTQVLDYASDLDAMTADALAAHISAHSGTDGIEPIHDFEQWYADEFGKDMAGLTPPRMVLVGFGVDTAAERMARFVSNGSADLSVVTFHGFKRGEERWLARQVEVAPEKRPIDILYEYLARDGYVDLFDRVRKDIEGLLTGERVRLNVGRYGLSFALPEPDRPKTWRTHFGVWAGYDSPGAYTVTILQPAFQRGGYAVRALEDSLNPWSGETRALNFKSAHEWDRIRGTLRDFIRVVVENRAAATASDA